MLRLVYRRAADRHEKVTVYGEAIAIADLYWQLTRNHLARDGTAIGSVEVTDTEGRLIPGDNLLQHPWSCHQADTTVLR